MESLFSNASIGHAVGLVSYELCAGVCEPDDASPLESARRELLEETGYGNGEWEELDDPFAQSRYAYQSYLLLSCSECGADRKSASRTDRGYCRWSCFLSKRCGLCSIATGCCRLCMPHHCGNISLCCRKEKFDFCSKVSSIKRPGKFYR